MNIILIGISIYILFQLVLGFYISRFIKSEDDYLLGGKKLGYILATFSIFATWFGAESCIGTAGATYSSGLAGVTADPFGYGIVLLLMGFFFAIPLYKMNLTTIADFFKKRFSPSTEKVIAIFMIPTSILWAAAQIRAFGLILSSSSNLTVEFSILISAVLVITYTVFGGLLADAWTDLIQGILLIIGLLILITLIFFNGINIKETFLLISSEKFTRLSSTVSKSLSDIFFTIEEWAIPICGSLIAQELVSRVFAARSHKVAQRSSILAGSLYIFVGLIPLTIGLIGLNILPDIEHPEQILPLIAQKYLSPVIYIIFAGALISAILSTVDSTLLASSALMSHNIAFSIFNVNDEKKKLIITRINVLISGIVAYFLATKAEGVYNLVKDASAFGSSGIFVVFIIGLISSFGNGLSAISSVIAGSVVWFISHYVFHFELSYLISLLSALCIYVLTALSEKWIYNIYSTNKKLSIGDPD
ncbi:MAG: sodium:solute symporter family protein [Ignavibacteria bacterium]